MGFPHLDKAQDALLQIGKCRQNINIVEKTQ